MPFVCDESRVEGTSAQLYNLVENQVVAQEARLGLMDLDLHDSMIRGQVVVIELNIWVNAHTSTPNEKLALICECHTMVVSEADVFDVLVPSGGVRVVVDKVDLSWSLHNQRFLVFETKLAIIVVTPGEHLSLGRDKTSVKISTSDLDYWDVKVDHVGNGWHVHHALDVLSNKLVLLYFFSIFWAGSHSTHYNESVSGVLVHAVEDCCHIARRNIIDNPIEHRVLDSSPHRAP